MPTVNTLVVDRADRLGPRPAPPAAGPGRAGPASGPTPTSSIPPDRALTEEAYERLKTIGEDTELGSGFKIAMRDLEIRGAGNLLGTGQSGHIAAVGYDLYVPDGHRGGRRAEGRAEPREPAEIKLDLPARRQPARRLRRPRRSCGSRPTGAWPRSRTAGRGRRHPRPSGRTATARCPQPAAALLDGRPAAGRVRPHRRPRGHRHQGRRRSADRSTSPACRPLALPTTKTDPPRAPLQGRGLQGGPAASSQLPAADGGELADASWSPRSTSSPRSSRSPSRGRRRSMRRPRRSRLVVWHLVKRLLGSRSLALVAGRSLGCRPPCGPVDAVRRHRRRQRHRHRR